VKYKAPVTQSKSPHHITNSTHIPTAKLHRNILRFLLITF
jgi:hypothetical protein